MYVERVKQKNNMFSPFFPVASPDEDLQLNQNLSIIIIYHTKIIFFFEYFFIQKKKRLKSKCVRK